MATPTQAALDQIRLAMAGTNGLFNTEVIRNRNLAALDEIYTADARILPPGVPLRKFPMDKEGSPCRATSGGNSEELVDELHLSDYIIFY